MTAQILTLTYDNSLTASFTADGWFNATAAAERFGKRVDHWLANAETKEYIALLCEENTRKVGDFIRVKRGRTGGTWLHPELAVVFARWLDLRFAIWCDRQIRALISGDGSAYDWRKARSAAASSFKVMNDILKLSRENSGKSTSPYHYANEARLVNWALLGEFKGVDREALASAELTLLAELEERNAVLLARGMEYANRKRELNQFATAWRNEHPHLIGRAA